MGVVAAGCFVVLGIWVVFILLSSLIDRFGGVLGGLILGAVFAVLLVIALVLFNNPLALFRRPQPPLSPEEAAAKRREEIEKLRKEGLLVENDYKAVRAFRISQYEDEGDCLFIELENKSVLVLIGQYLDEYTPNIDVDENKELPNTDFTLYRHRDYEEVVDVESRGSLIEFEEDFEAYTLLALAKWVVNKRGKPVQDMDSLPEDGDIITDRSFDQLLAAVRTGQTESEEPGSWPPAPR